MLKSTKDELLMNLWFYPIRIHNRFVHTTEKENNQQHHPRIHLELSDLVPAQRAMGGCLGSRRHGDNSSGESSDFAGSGVGLGGRRLQGLPLSADWFWELTADIWIFCGTDSFLFKIFSWKCKLYIKHFVLNLML